MRIELSRNLHFREGNFSSHLGHLSASDYGVLLDNVVVACVDLVVMAGGDIFIGQRRNEPAIHQWWTPGRKMSPGESREMAAQEIMKRELGLWISDVFRFNYLDFAPDFVWSTRAQEPVVHGCHMQTSYYLIVLEESERGKISVASDFLDSQWVSVEKVIDGTLDIDLHDAVRQAALRVGLVTGMIDNSWMNLLGRIVCRFFGDLIIR